MSDVDVNACALESLMSQLLHAQGFKSISLTVAPKSSMGSSTFSKKLTSYRVLTPFHFLLEVRLRKLQPTDLTFSAPFSVLKLINFRSDFSNGVDAVSQKKALMEFMLLEILVFVRRMWISVAKSTVCC